MVTPKGNSFKFYNSHKYWFIALRSTYCTYFTNFEKVINLPLRDAPYTANSHYLEKKVRIVRILLASHSALDLSLSMANIDAKLHENTSTLLTVAASLQTDKVPARHKETKYQLGIKRRSTTSDLKRRSTTSD